MVGKNMDQPLDEIGRWKNRRYPTGGDSTKLGGASAKIYEDKIYFLFYILLREVQQEVLAAG